LNNIEKPILVTGAAGAVGDALDFWRVLTVVPNQRLTLLAEMKVPGDAILDIQVQPMGEKQCELLMISRFLPRGLGGFALLVCPFTLSYMAV
jgi:hypothetical protein